MADLRKKIVMIVSVVIVGISLIFTFVNYQNYSAKVDENEKQYHDLKSEYEDVTKKQKPVSEDDVKNGLNSAKKSGDDVANLLNQYLCALPYTGTNFTKEQEKEKADMEHLVKKVQEQFSFGSNRRGSADYRRHIAGVLVKRACAANEQQEDRK